MSIPTLIRDDGRVRLLVDGAPFLILGLQWDCDSCFSKQEMNPLFAEARRMGANTASLPLYWREIEPSPGRYDFAMLEERLQQARANDLRVVLLWFGTWKNGCAFYAPDHVRDERGTYRYAQDRDGHELVSFCPSAEATWTADRNALVAVAQYLRDHDQQDTVILLQIENESGILGSPRCFCDTCNQLFEEGRYAERFGRDADEALSVVCFATYIDRLAREVKTVKSLLCYTNAWLSQSAGRVPGTYPSGGPVPQMLQLYREQLRHLDFVAPDIYAESARDFSRIASQYAEGAHPLYIAEHSSSLSGRAERNAFYALAKAGAIGFDPWAIDSPYPEMYGEPLVDPVGHEWGRQAYWLRDSYVAIGRAIAPIVEAQGTDKLFCFVQEPGERGTVYAGEFCTLQITFHDRENMSRGFVVERSPTEYLLIGTGFSVRFRQPGRDAAVPVQRADFGYFEGDTFKLLHPMRRERLEREGLPVPLLEPGVVRVVLNTSNL